MIMLIEKGHHTQKLKWKNTCSINLIPSNDPVDPEIEKMVNLCENT